MARCRSGRSGRAAVATPAAGTGALNDSAGRGASVHVPVFYDRSGKRLRRLVAACCLLAVIAVGVGCYAVPAVLAPILPNAVQDNHWARQIIDTGAGSGDTTPAVGDFRNGALTRL